MDKRMQETRDRLRIITRRCRDDMHEPDEQGVTAHVIGEKFDNAMGTAIDEQAICERWQEIVVIIRRDEAGSLPERFNLADLIALARKAR